MGYFNQENNSLYLDIAFVIVLVILFLSMADAAAYARCSTPGICEFLDIPGICEFLDPGDISQEAKSGFLTFSTPKRGKSVSRPLLIKDEVLTCYCHQQLRFSIPRYKDLMYHELVPSPSTIPLCFLKITCALSKHNGSETIKKRIFFPFNQSILRTSIIIS